MAREDYEIMGPSKKDLEDISEQTTKLMALVPILACVLRPLARLGFLRRFLARSTGGRVGKISSLAARGDHQAAADLAIEFLRENRHRPGGRWSPSGRDFWWFFMDLATRSLGKLDDPEKWDEVIEMARSGVEPFQGYHVARSFLAISHRAFETGDYDAAAEFAETAVRADESWAEPDFTLGWYHLVLGGGDPVEHLTRAVLKDPGILFRIAKDPECRRHPHIIRKLKDLAAERAAGSAP